jgi:hypothetical protein
MSELRARSPAQVVDVIMCNNLADLPGGGQKKSVLYEQCITAKTLRGSFTILHEVKTKREMHYIKNIPILQ